MDAVVRKLDAARQPAASTKLALIAPRPRSLEQTGLDHTLVAELIEKHLLDSGVLTIGALSLRMALSGQIIEAMLHFLRKEARVEVRAGENSAALRYALTDRGRVSALTALTRSGYIGPAPVTIDAYTQIACTQTVHQGAVTHDSMHRAFSDTILRQALLDQLGPAMNSGRAIFVYGAAGTGKTFITQRLARLLSDTVLIPHAVAVNETIFAIFDPVLHHRVNEPNEDPNILLDQGHDPRFVACRRPVVISGGELCADMLEMHYDPDTRDYRAPLQLKANNGLFI
ncbi:MAG: AAA family ATPase, partial [Woeseiaceae bacterium]